MNTKELLLKQTVEAFDGEMSLRGSLEGLSQEEASWRLNDKIWTIEEVVYHVASCKIEYCRQGFGKWDTDYPKPIGTISAMIKLLVTAQDHLVNCLNDCSMKELGRPIKTQFHGQTAEHFFWVMIMHDISHGAQIRTIRRAYGTRTDFYPV